MRRPAHLPSLTLSASLLAVTLLTTPSQAGSTIATMPGTIVAVNVAVGDEVNAGDVLLVMEAMKMELSIAATTAGVVTAVAVAANDTVDAGAVLVIVDEIDAD